MKYQMDSVKEILKSFPLLIPNADFTVWTGIIFFKSEEVPVTISTPHFPSLTNVSVMCPIEMKGDVQQEMSNYVLTADSANKGLPQLLQYLRSREPVPSHASNVVSGSKPDNSWLVKMDYYLYNQILSELKQLHSEDIVACRGDLSEVTLRTVDERGVQHNLVVGLPTDYPSSRPTVVDMDLPEVALQELSKAKTILEMFNTFRTLIDSFQDFWLTYDSLKSNTWLIDPEHPRLKDTHCRIIIGDNVSMLITLNPQDVNTCPDIKFLGPESATVSFINSMEKKLKAVGWNEDVSVLDNLLSLLGLEQFPQRDSESETTVDQGECSICFMLRLDDQALPNKVCNNTKCNAYFHLTCLAQWFQAIPTNETSFNFISGDCPCCGERILCPIQMS